jgi:hypothetical protein
MAQTADIVGPAAQRYRLGVWRWAASSAMSCRSASVSR